MIHKMSISSHHQWLLALAFVGLTLAVTACDEGLEIAVDNRTDESIFVEVDGSGQAEVEPRSQANIGRVGHFPDDQVITIQVRPKDGGLLHRETLTVGELKARGRPIVIEDVSATSVPP